jgi:hypothetical protein
MRTPNVSIALSSLALGLVLGCGAAPEDRAQENGQASPGAEESAQTSTSEALQTASPQVDKEAQARIAASTLKLERAFSDQFVRGAIDREALSGPIKDAVESFPESARPEVQKHIDAVIDQGAQAASQMTPEERSDMAQPPEKLDKSQQDLIGGWGWPGGVGWGGMGAFGFPGFGAGFGGWGGGGWWGGRPFVGGGWWGGPGWGGGWVGGWRGGFVGGGWGGGWRGGFGRVW